MKIRELRAADATRCAELESQLFAGDNPWPRDVFLVEFNHPWTFYWGVFDEELLVGYAGVAMLGPREDPEFEVHTIGVDPAYQGRGLGRALMDQMVHAADAVDAQMFLEVRTDNGPAIGLYEKYGFTVLATRKNYYQPSGADAYTMARKSLSESRSEK
ncbi:ribosomal protein S18-alanine N-acetyltransferase [Corynebacterium guangdongense]|uniref:Ribosomal-protein-alanine N-acetyltransferase n=1 Tax=Corynebacterium guangdongense TaxID=1783348 RepID=A0ABU1ZUH9_9CORY|nr:ribosomal protein S18-alanine N-acetyltransferase [Corynebacterium guangdongense]MDR7328581.1 ribosomal-protein-alanine N-acetyltransferase [Corynebacterium guangdongense]WJZ17158.1 ribosomal-protein-alanine N-acetyltransferase [Corynebacterium guangdongense]